MGMAQKCVVYMYCIVDCYDLIFSIYIYVMYICIVLHYVFFPHLMSSLLLLLFPSA